MTDSFPELHLPTSNRIQTALVAKRHGYEPIPIPHKSKNPNRRGWQTEGRDEDKITRDFAGEGNIGLLLGEPSGGLVDVDCDAEEVLQCQSLFLPPTGLVHGRLSKPKSHFWYKVPGVNNKTKKFTDVDGTCLIELRGKGGQTVIPPSVHPSGELLAFSSNAPPSLVSFDVIEIAVKRIAATSLIARHWPQRGTRNETAMALAGLLIRGGVEEETATLIIETAARIGGSDESKAYQVKQTAERLRNGEDVTAYPRAKELLIGDGEAVLRKVSEWLGLASLGHGTVQANGSLRPLNIANIKAGQTFNGTKPTLPELAWNPILDQIRSLISPCTEAPFEYIFASSYAMIGLAIGRSAYTNMGRRIRTNVFAALLGPAAYRKGTPYAILNDVVIPRIDISKWNAKFVQGTGSAEGMLEQFMTTVAEPPKGAGRPRTSLQPSPGRRILAVEEELGNLLVKAHRSGTANIREIYIQLWDGVDINPPTRTSQLAVREPFFSLLTMSTIETLEQRIEEGDILSGLLPRFTFFDGIPRALIPWPSAPDLIAANAIADEMDMIYQHAVLINERQSGLMNPTATVRERWKEVYAGLRAKAEAALTPAAQLMLARIDIHIAKAALFYAVSNGHSQIESDDLDRALALGDYISETANLMANIRIGDDSQKVEDTIINVAFNNGNGEWISSSASHRSKFGGRIKAFDFYRTLRSLAKVGVIEIYGGDDDRPKYFRAANQGAENVAL